jgi:hypothetical protein
LAALALVDSIFEGGLISKPLEKPLRFKLVAPDELGNHNAKTGAISSRTPAVIVEYDMRGGRAQKLFTDAYLGRRFFVAKDKAGKNPKVVNPLKQ